MSEPNPDYVHEKVQGIDVVTFCHPEQFDERRPGRILSSLRNLVHSGIESLVLDFSNLDFSSLGLGKVGDERTTREFVSLVGVVGVTMSDSKPSQHTRSGRILRICPDRETALNEISRSESGQLVVCSVSLLREVFRTCGLCDDRD